MKKVFALLVLAFGFLSFTPSAEASWFHHHHGASHGAHHHHWYWPWGHNR